MNKSISLFVGVFAAFFLTAAGAVAASPEIYLKTKGFGSKWTHAVNGYDTVSFHQEGGPVKGGTQFETEYLGARWLFASQENLDLFLANPDKYRPAYGGYCAYALGVGSGLVHGDPEAWSLHNGVLYLNLNKGVRRRWLKDPDGYIEKADAVWPGILSE